MTRADSPKTRREFLKTTLKTTTTGVALGSLILGGISPQVHASGDETIKIALVGCGGRGAGAAVNALSTAGPTKLVAMADLFADRLNAAYDALSHELPEKVETPEDRRFVGFDAYKKAIDCLGPGDVVLLATPPGFRPVHVEYAVNKGVHVFMEKPFATDTPGTKRIKKAAELADQKNLKIACGLMWRHCKAREAVVERIHNGEIGDVTLLRGFRLHPPYRISPRHEKASMGELEYQIRGFHYFDWVGASVFIDYCIHNFDTACWAKGMWPESALGFGGRSTPEVNGTGFDTYYTEFTFPDGSVLASHGHYCDNCFDRYSDYVHGTKGSAVLMDGLAGAKTRTYKNQKMTPENLTWQFGEAEPNPYQVEHDLFFDAIRNNKPYNEGHRAVEAQYAAMLSRAAINTGQLVTWDQIVNSTVELLPGGIDNISWETVPEFLPDKDGHYPYAIPGVNVRI